ncbi:MAG TPA: hypothetical protein VF665_08770 [Longimicrobium sp.]|jgi:hypothetical protein|uniref:hypothetical protein n=1 Tax=Longimicrobium sp. TaxID=2029185 RepID=UPI002ED9DBFD
MADDPILDARTVTELCTAINQTYALNLPVQFDAGTVLAALWALAVTVTKDPRPGTRYEATATGGYPVVPALPGTLTVDVLDTSAGPQS